MMDLIDPVVPDLAPAVRRPRAPVPDMESTGAQEAAGSEVPLRPNRHVHVGSPKTFNPDAAFEAGVLRSAATGAVVGFLLLTVIVGLLGKWTGLDDSGSLFLGMFTGLWGGLGFGAMIGSVLAATRREHRDRHREDAIDTVGDSA